MQLWYFRVKVDVLGESKKLYVVEQIDEELIRIHYDIDKYITTFWTFIDEAKRLKFIEYLYTITVDEYGIPQDNNIE